MSHPAYQSMWPTRFNFNEMSKTVWSIKNGGSMRAVNTGGAVTGFGCGVRGKKTFGGALVIDDPNKATDARYELELRKVNEDFDEALVSRLNNQYDPIVIIMQRLHEMDLSGHVLSGKSNAGKFTHFNFPALKEGPPNDHDHREEGEPLWVNKHNKEQLLDIKKSNPQYFATQLQQRPAPMEGAIFKREWVKRYSKLPESFNQGEFISVDLNAAEEGGSNACMARYGVENQNIYLIDQRVGQWGFPEAVMALQDFAGTDYSALLIEAKANGHAMISTLQKAGYHGIIPIKVNQNKVYRFNEVAPLYIAGNVIYPEEFLAPWVEDHITELLLFPNGKHDDRVDAETQMLKYFLMHLATSSDDDLPFSVF